ncbi:hypothetical protein K9757_14370 [Clostridioides difficile]|uniref:hypothetical protein n=1 Tax=Clostridioides difficile TaxID=1496 RepID=UPI000417B628|nr:hypothetical protein [Clostridioides difficile]EIS9734252.1 hypothetical protein [Clostridioides difficile]MBF9964117.1 hypothetical protein [Clostridioides difficile]MBG0191030.1 hypothetical protein [Clostridioides difficile]MBH6920012.1 hypothetical protein [Clostridioides difficile]MBH7310694.1 hypothetical protein [Clostridioides difficile]
MKEYVVEIPITGHMGVCIKAENKEDAKKLALKQCSIDYIKEWFTDDENIQVRELKYKL